jgi:hypothetical protein
MTDFRTIPRAGTGFVFACQYEKPKPFLGKYPDRPRPECLLLPVLKKTKRRVVVGWQEDPGTPFEVDRQALESGDVFCDAHDCWIALDPARAMELESARWDQWRTEQEAAYRDPFDELMAQIERLDPRRAALRFFGLDAAATSTDLKRVYRAHALREHPDRGGDPVRFQQLQEYYEQACRLLTR